MKIHLLDNDPRQFTDKENYPFNMGPFSRICVELNRELKKLGYYSEPDDADWVGTSDGLNIGFKYKNKKSFVISVWETSNTLPYYLIHTAQQSKQRIFGLSNQITDLWKKYGFNAQTLYPGCDTEFWKSVNKKDKDFTFLHINSSNVRSGLDLSIQAFTLAFANNKNVKLIVKDTNNSELLKNKIYKFVEIGANIEYISERTSDFKVRELYSKSHVCLNLLRSTSFGLPLLECSACGCLCVTGNTPPTNEIINKDCGILIEPYREVSIGETITDLELNEWGLLNCYPKMECPERSMFYDFNVFEYSKKIKDIYENWENYSSIDTRSFVVNNWNWNKSANKLVEYLSK